LKICCLPKNLSVEGFLMLQRVITALREGFYQLLGHLWSAFGRRVLPHYHDAEMKRRVESIQRNYDHSLKGARREYLARVRKYQVQVSALENECKELRALSIQDRLTGLLNRHGGDTVMEEVVEIVHRSKGVSAPPVNMAFIIFDLDKFKGVNDTFGHDAGDRVLRVVAEIMREVFHRKTDRLCRHGGDEFLATLLQTSPEQAMRLASLFAERVSLDERLSFEGVGHVTASIGISMIDTGSHDTHSAYQQAVARADEAMYAAKEQGGNMVCIL
jgi:diguanylate cyclase (GGDEF)-like protein